MKAHIVPNHEGRDSIMAALRSARADDVVWWLMTILLLGVILGIMLRAMVGMPAIATSHLM